MNTFRLAAANLREARDRVKSILEYAESTVSYSPEATAHTTIDDLQNLLKEPSMNEWPHQTPIPGWTTPEESFIVVEREKDTKGIFLCAGNPKHEVQMTLSVAQAKELLTMLSGAIQEVEGAQ